jgi:hypothetical protein
VRRIEYFNDSFSEILRSRRRIQRIENQNILLAKSRVSGNPLRAGRTATGILLCYFSLDLFLIAENFDIAEYIFLNNQNFLKADQFQHR